jgi:hypothetical protein
MGALLEELAARFGFELSWRQGFELEAHEVPAEFRGPEVWVLARRVAAFQVKDTEGADKRR